MITNDELNIANTSYTNKDFQTIYSEILELAQKISNRWNPDQSNESDPGIVLLKLMAFIADKNNYNIDKNVLEAFMPSATQMSSMRNLCEMNGYNMKYYNSATTSVKFMYTGSSSDGLSDSFTMTLPAFTTTITDEDGNVTYSLLQDCVLSKKNLAQSVTCIEGTFQDLMVNNSNILHLSSLDDDNRIYFSVENVAENGIRIYNSSESSSDYYGDYWEKVDNLNNQELGSKVYKFGYDSVSSLPYVEFPSDIATLISSGIRIRYIETTGESGNISANILNKLSSTTSVDVIVYNDGEASDTVTVTLSTSNLLINNPSSTNNGSNPESIDEAYSNFKKTVGTFETLVTCRDYMNAIYNMEDSSLNPLVSNCQVTDRRTDYNYANNILVSDDTSTYVNSYSDSSNITPYDLCCYALNPLTTSYTPSTYNNSFKPITSSLNTITSLLDDSKCISHNFKTLENTDVFAFKNYYSLQATITTMQKVNTYEQSEILSNVYNALYKNFYSRKLEYGQEIPFDSILSVMEDADTRIKSVSLLEPTLNTKVLTASGGEIDFDLSSTTSINYVIPYLAKNVLSGKIALFSFDNRFVNTYGQSNSTVYENLVSAKTEVTINSSREYTLKENEVVQLIAPSYVVDLEYSANTNYRFESTSTSTTLKKDTIHKLSANETLKLNWTDSSGVVHDVTYTNGDIVRPNKEISVTTKGTITKNNESYDQLGSSDKIEHLVQSSYTITSSSLPCYWILNSGRTLFDNTTKTRILQDNEYFFYSNSALTEMVTLGSGTRLTIDGDISAWTIPSDETILSADDIMSNGISAFSGLNWKYKSGFNKITVDEMQIITLTEGMKVVLNDTSITSLNNNFKPTSISVSPIITYTQGETSTDVPQIEIEDSTWQIRSRLDLNASSTKGQYINDSQSLTLTYKEASGETTSQTLTNKYVKFNTAIQFSGSDKIDLSVTDLATGEVTNDVSCLAYTYTDVESSEKGVSKTDEHIVLDFSKISANTNTSIPLNIINKNAINLIPMYLIHTDTSSDVTYTFKVFKGSSQVSDNIIRLYNRGDYSSSLSLSLNAGENLSKMYTIEIDCSNFTSSDTYYLYISSNKQLKDSMQIGNLTTVTGVNSKLGLTTSEDESKLLAKIKEFDSNNNFYYLNSSTSIDVDDMLSPRALFDVNNVANNITISQLDTESFGKINIARTSKS